MMDTQYHKIRISYIDRSLKQQQQMLFRIACNSLLLKPKRFSFFSFVICLKYIANLCILYLDVLDGYNGTIFAYGQTASGKTHTMEVSFCSERQNAIHIFIIFNSIRKAYVLGQKFSLPNVTWSECLKTTVQYIDSGF